MECAISAYSTVLIHCRYTCCVVQNECLESSSAFQSYLKDECLSRMDNYYDFIINRIAYSGILSDSIGDKAKETKQ